MSKYIDAAGKTDLSAVQHVAPPFTPENNLVVDADRRKRGGGKLTMALRCSSLVQAGTVSASKIVTGCEGCWPPYGLAGEQLGGNGHAGAEDGGQVPQMCIPARS